MRQGAGAGPFNSDPAVNGELGLAVEDDEHLLALVVKVRADSALRLNYAAVQKLKVWLQRMGIE